VLEHKHYQVVSKRLPVSDAAVAFSTTVEKDGVAIEFLNFPAAAARVRTDTAEGAMAISLALLNGWRSRTMAGSFGDRGLQADHVVHCVKDRIFGI